MFSMFVSVSAGVFTIYIYSRQVGWQHFLPQKVNLFLQDVSIFDILVSIFIYRKFSKAVMAVMQPFFQAETPEQAKFLLT